MPYHTAISANHGQQRVGERMSLLVLVLIILSALLFYGRGYQYIPGDDASNTLNGARYLAEMHTTTFLHPLNPDLGGQFYSTAGLISSEFPLHIALAEIFLLVGVHAPLTAANIFVLCIFSLTGVLVYLVFLELLRSRLASLVGVALMLFSYWYGYSFWSGHYAQILAYPVLLFLVMCLLRFARHRKGKWLLLGGVGVVILFPIHSLSFLVGASTFIGYILVDALFVERHQRSRTLHLIAIGFGFLALLAFLLWFSRSASYRQIFSVESIQSIDLSGILFRSFEQYLGGFLLLVGAFVMLRKKIYPLLAWFVVTYALVNSSLLGFPFFTYRFSEYASFPILLLAVLGFFTMLRLLQSRGARVLVLTSVLALYIPYNIFQQTSIRSCYITYCEGLNPASILPEDYKAFQWVGEHTPPGSTFIAVQKFGNFLPAVAVRKTAVPVPTSQGGNAAFRALTAATQRERWEASRELPAQYILWDAVFDRYQSTYVPYQIFTEHFDDPKLFRRVYNADHVRIYEVLP